MTTLPEGGAPASAKDSDAALTPPISPEGGVLVPRADLERVLRVLLLSPWSKSESHLQAEREIAAMLSAAPPISPRGVSAMTREEAEARIRACRGDQAWQARWMAKGAEEVAEWRRICAVANGKPDPALSLPTGSGEGLADLRKALEPIARYVAVLDARDHRPLDDHTALAAMTGETRADGATVFQVITIGDLRALAALSSEAGS